MEIARKLKKSICELQNALGLAIKYAREAFFASADSGNAKFDGFFYLIELLRAIPGASRRFATNRPSGAHLAEERGDEIRADRGELLHIEGHGVTWAGLELESSSVN